MKLKNTLYIISLFSICALDAKRIAQPGYNPGVTPPSTPTPYVPAPTAPAAPKPAEPKPVTNQFQSLLHTIRNSNQANVITSNGEIVPKIREDIQNSKLAPEQKQALLQAAVTVKMPFSTTIGNSDTVGIINNAMAQASSMVKEGAQRQPVATEPFYNPETKLFNQLYLESQVKFARADDLTLDEAEKSLIHELMPMIINAWKKRNIAVSRSQVDAAREQIFTAVTQDYKSSKSVTPSTGWENNWQDQQSAPYAGVFTEIKPTQSPIEKPKSPAMQKPQDPEAKAIAQKIVEQYSNTITSDIIDRPSDSYGDVIISISNALFKEVPSLKQTNANVLSDLIIDACEANKLILTPPLKSFIRLTINREIEFEKTNPATSLNPEELQTFMNGLVQQSKYTNKFFDAYGNPNYANIIDIVTQVVQKYPQLKNKADKSNNINNIVISLIKAIGATGYTVSFAQKQLIGSALSNNWNKITE